VRRGGGVGPRGVGVTVGTVGVGVRVAVDEEADKRAVAVSPALSGVAEVNGEGVPSEEAAPGVAVSPALSGVAEVNREAVPSEGAAPGVAELADVPSEAVPVAEDDGISVPLSRESLD